MPLLHPSVSAVYDRVASLYDTAAAHWDEIAGGPAAEQFRTLVRQKFPRGSQVLDVGTGTGRSIAPLSEEARPSRVVGVDLSAGMLAKARTRFAGAAVELVRADATRLPFPAETFDAVTSMWMLETLPDPLAAVREFLRVLRPDGIVLTAFSTLPPRTLQQVRARLIELVMQPLFAGRFLPEQERPLHTCTMACAHRYDHDLAAVATFGKRCELSAAALPHRAQ